MDKVLGKRNMKKVGPAAWRSVACNQNIPAAAAVMPAIFWLHATLCHAAGLTFFVLEMAS